MLQILKTKQKEIAMKKRKSYPELEPVKKKRKLCLERFCHYYNNVKNKKKDCKDLYSCITCFKKKGKARARLHMSCLVFGQLPNWEKLFFPCVSQSMCCLLHLLKHERKFALNNAKKIHNCADYFYLDLIHLSSQNFNILRVSRFLP